MLFQVLNYMSDLDLIRSGDFFSWSKPRASCLSSETELIHFQVAGFEECIWNYTRWSSFLGPASLVHSHFPFPLRGIEQGNVAENKTFQECLYVYDHLPGNWWRCSSCSCCHPRCNSLFHEMCTLRCHTLKDWWRKMRRFIKNPPRTWEVLLWQIWYFYNKYFE